jgi:hypothetical protein
MRVLGLAIGAAIVVTTHAAASDARFEKSLQMLAPSERLEQLCDYTAMVRIRKEMRQFRPDRAVANATAEIQQKSHSIVAKGAAFRSRGKWYALSFTCKAEPDHLKIESFHYSIGKEIPAAKWASFGLWQ